MKEKLQALIEKVKPLLQKLYIASPFVLGVAVGYLGKPIIQLAVNVVVGSVKLLLG
jgi:hypothetical protein